MKCIYCDNKKLYKLKTSQFKCSACKRKFSYRAILTQQKVCECFCDGLTAYQTSKELNLNYITVRKKYHLFRQLIASFSEQEYQDKEVLEYDEYIYLQKSKKKIKQNIFDAQNFLTFHYEDKIYNIMMPNLSIYKNQFLDDGAEEAYFKEFSKYMMFNKISTVKKTNNLITKFWLFFEDSIVKYKGVKNENLFYYLKEIEFKFNYSKKIQKKILIEILQN